MGRNAGKSVRFDEDRHARLAERADRDGVTIAEVAARAVDAYLNGARASVTVPGQRARTPRRTQPAPISPAGCGHPISRRIGNECAACGATVR